MKNTLEKPKTTKWDRIAKHGLAILSAFPNATESDPIELCKKLRRIELRTEKVALDYCNGACGEKRWGIASSRAFREVVELLNPQTEEARDAIKINSDPRGYALKLEDEWMKNPANNASSIQRDWGGYGLLAPEITE